MSRLKDLVALLVALSKIVPIDALAALIRAAAPLPKKPTEVRPYLNRVGITDPLAAVIAPTIEKLLEPTPLFADAPEDLAADAADLADALGADLEQPARATIAALAAELATP
jgi:hypothetical protein